MIRIEFTFSTDWNNWPDTQGTCCGRLFTYGRPVSQLRFSHRIGWLQLKIILPSTRACEELESALRISLGYFVWEGQTKSRNFRNRISWWVCIIPVLCVTILIAFYGIGNGRISCHYWRRYQWHFVCGNKKTLRPKINPILLLWHGRL